MTNPAVCHDKVVNQQFVACSGSPHDDESSHQLENIQGSLYCKQVMLLENIQGSLYCKQVMLLENIQGSLYCKQCSFIQLVYGLQILATVN